MSRNKALRFVYWFLASAFFFAAAGLVISTLKAGPTETQVMRFMSGMMTAMHNSMMGASMDNAETYMGLLRWSAGASMVMTAAGLIIGIPIKLWRKT